MKMVTAAWVGMGGAGRRLDSYTVTSYSIVMAKHWERDSVPNRRYDQLLLTVHGVIERNDLYLIVKE